MRCCDLLTAANMRAWVLFALLSLGAVGARAQPGELVTPAPGQRSAAALKQRLPLLADALRMRAVGVDRRELALAAESFTTKRRTPLQLRLFDDVVVEIELTRSEHTHSGGLALAGRVVGDIAGSAVLVDNDGVLAIGVSRYDRHYAVLGNPDDGYVVCELPPPGQPGSRQRSDAVPLPADLLQVAKAATPSPNAAAPADDGSSIDLMVLYTPAARDANGGSVQIQAAIDAQIAFINLIYQNSGVVQRLRLVYRGEVELTEASPFDDLYNLNRPWDGRGDEVQVLRDIYRADLVNVWGVWPALGGIAYLGTPEGLSVLPFYAVSLTSSPSSTQATATTMAHEIGHSMGLTHDPINAPGGTVVTPEGSSTPTNIQYAHGYVDSVNRFRTLMSYDSCYPAFLCRELPLHSNPDLTHDNASWYPSALPAPLGDAVNGDESRALDDTRDSLANYRPSLPALSGPGILTFDFSRRDIAEGGGMLTIMVNRRNGASGAVSVDYATVAGSALASDDFSPISGTLSWEDGDSSARTLAVPIIQDSVLEGLEDFRVTLANASGGATLGGHGNNGAAVAVTIVDDEPDVFPVGDALPPGFGTPGISTGAWSVDRSRGYRSTASLQSAVTYMVETSPGVYSDSFSDLEYTGQFANGNIRFAYQLSSAHQHVKFEFMIDNVVVFTQPGGQTEWENVSQFVSAGTHSLRWRFTNQRQAPCPDDSIVLNGGRACADRAWIDEVELPLGAVIPSSHYAYIANNGSNNVSVIDVASNTVVATVTVGTNPNGVATHPDGTRVYVSNGGSASVSVIDTYTQQVVATIPVGTLPHGIAVTPDGSRVLVAHGSAGYLAVIDTTSNTRLPDIASSQSGVGLAINPTGTRAYMAINNGSAVQVFDLIANAAIATTTLSNRSFGVAVSADGARAYVVQNQAGRVAIVNTANNSYSNFFSVPGQPIGVAVSPASGRVYTTTGSGNSLAVYDPANFNVTSVPVGTAPYGVAVTHAGDRIYVTNSGSNSVSVLDATVNAVVATIPVGSGPRSTGQFIAPVSVPGPPRALLAGPGDGQITLSFSPPLSDGGIAISQYSATCMPGGFVAGGTASPLRVSGLANGTAYTCTVTATNVRGIGLTSAPVVAMPGTGSFIISGNAASFTVLSPGSFSIATSGAPVTSIGASGALPAGVTLSTSGVLAGTPASGSVGDYPLLITASNGTPPHATQAFTLSVQRAAQQIEFASLPARSLTEGSFTLSLSGGASGNAVVVSSQTSGVCTVSGLLVSLHSGGTCTLTANQAGNIDYTAAAQLQQSFTVRWPQTIAFGPAPTLVYGAQRQLSATGGASGNPVRFSSATPTVCSTSGLNGFEVNAVAVGSCRVVANQAGNANYDAAPAVELALEIGRAPQVLAFSGTPLQIGQTVRRDTSIGASSMPVVLQSSTPGVCTTSGLSISAIGPGYCRFSANQAGDGNYLPAAEVQVTLKSTTLMAGARSHHSATRLLDGRVLVVGGQTTGGGIHASAEIYNPATMSWSATGSLAQERMEHRAVLLPDGRVLVIGGYGNNFVLVAMTEIYDPVSGTWSAAGALARPRQVHSATLIPGSPTQVLVAGGVGQDNTLPAQAEIWRADTQVWSAGGNLAQARFGHSAALLADGRVLVSGGGSAANTTFGSSEIYNPSTNLWSAASATAARTQHTATVLPDGSVLLAAGYNNSTPVNTAVRYLAASNTWVAAGNSSPARATHTATLLANGRVLLAAGVVDGTTSSATVLYDPASNAWTPTSSLLFERRAHTATLLLDGSVLIVGGIMNGGNFPRTNSAELYQPDFALLAADLPAVAVGSAYAPLTLSTVGGREPIVFSIASGALPTGMTLSTAGVLSGTPNLAGGFDFTVSATDAGNASATRSYHLDVGHTVTPSAGANGGIVPATPQLVLVGASTTFTLSPDPEYAAIVAGSCGGSLTGNLYTTDPVAADCTVVASFVSNLVVPDAPVIGVAQAGIEQATIDFSAPAVDGGTPILSYSATSTPGGHVGNCAAPCTRINVAGLTTGSAYQFAVRATNRIGSGPASALSNSVTPLLGQSIVFGPAPVVYIGFPASVSASGGGSSNPVVLSSLTPALCSVTGDVVTALGTGLCQIAANQAGNAQYFPAPQATQSFNVGYRLHLVTPSAGVNGSIAPASAFQVVHGGVRTLTLTPFAGYTPLLGGTCGGTLSGNEYTTAPIVADCSVVASFARVPNAPAIGTASASDAQATVSFSAPADDGGDAIVSYAATSAPGGQSGTCSAPCTSITVSGLSNGTEYTLRVTASNRVGPGPASAESNSVTPLAPQTISFGPPPQLVVGGSGTLTATGGGSGNPVVFVSRTPAVCGSGGNNGADVSGIAAGTCTIAANQAAGPAHAAAPETLLDFPVTATFVVSPSAGPHGTISPATPQTVNSGAHAVFAVTPEAGYVATVGGSCGGTLVDTQFTTAAINASCSVVASFVSVPAAPTMVSATPLAGAARIAFTAPVDNGGSAILDYTASCTPGVHAASAASSPIDVQNLSNQVVYRCSVRARNAQGSGPASAELGVIPGSTGNSADLAISKSNALGYVNDGAPIDYLITVSNPGPAGVIGARVQDPLAPDFANANWTCTPTGNAVCAASGQGGLDQLLDLPASSSVQILFSATPLPGTAPTLTNIASVIPPAGTSDPNLGNNNAIDGPDVRGLFRSGFE